MSTLICSDDNTKGIKWEDLETMLTRLVVHTKENPGFFSEWEEDFILTMEAKYHRYHGDMYLSTKQLEILNRLDEKIGD